MMRTIHPLNMPHAGRGLLGALLATLAVAALLLLGPARPASAAPPTLTASENPVVIPLSSTTKTITLNWNLHGLITANLAIGETGGPTPLSIPVITQTGALPLTATYGKSYTATLSDPTNANPPATLQITTKRPLVIADPGDIGECVIHLCISSAAFAPHGTYADLTVKTSKPAHFEVQASTDAPNASGVFAHVDSAMFNLSNVTQWDTYLFSLTPNTTYHYVIKATTSGGETVKKSGTFKTLRRRAEVTFADIKVTDDSDDLSACDCTFWFQAHNLAPKSYGPVQVDTDHWTYPNVKFTVDNAPDTLTLRVEGQDNDVDFGQFCTNGTGPSWSVGHNSCISWTGGSFTVNTAATGFGEEFTQSFSGPWFNYSGELNFHLYGSYKVTYVP